MNKEKGSEPDERPGNHRFKSFAELASAFGRAEGSPERFDRSSLKFGAIFWIPNEVTGFGPDGGEHPWVTVVPYRKGYPAVVACPRTSQVERNLGKGLMVPAGVVSGLERGGVILLGIRRS